MTTPTNDWDMVLGLNQNFLSNLTTSLYDSGRIPASFNKQIKDCQVVLELSAPTVSFVGDAAGGDSGDTCGFTGDARLLAVSVPVVGTMTCPKGGPQQIDGTVSVTMNLAEMVLSAVAWPDYLQTGGVPGESADCGDHGSFGECTLEAWVRTTTQAFQTIMLFGEAAPSLSLADDALRLYWGGDYYDSNDPSGATVSDGKWHHVAATVDGTGLISFYKDGQLKGSFPMPGAQQSAGALQLGAAYSYPFGGAAAFDGDMAQVRVWNYARTAAQIQQAMNTALAGNEDGLAGYWTFAGGAVVNLVDGGKGAVAGGAQVVNLPESELSHSLNLYFLDPGNVFCASCDVSQSEKINQQFAGLIQSQLDEAAAAPADLGTVSPSDDSKGSAMLPTYAVTAMLENDPSDPADDQLVFMMMAQNRPQPAGDPGTEFAGDAAVALPPGSNLVFALWDYYLFDSLAVPAMAGKFGVDESYFSVSQNPVVLTLNEEVKFKTEGKDGEDGREVTLTGLTMKITEDGLYVEVGTKAQPIAVPWLVTFSFTLGVSVRDASSGQQGLTFTLHNPSASFKADESGPNAWVLGIPIIAIIVVLLAYLWDAIFSFLLGDVSKTKMIDAGVFTVTDIVFDQGILMFGDFAPEAAAQLLPAASPQTVGAGNEAASVSDTSAAPVISGFSPEAGDADTLVTVRGTGLGAANSVKFNGTTAAYFRAKSDGEVLARPGAGASAGPISVATPAGTAVSETSFAFLSPPVITGFSDPDEIHLPGDAVTITGSNFAGAASVSFGNSKVAAEGFSVNSAGTQIVAEIPDGAVSGPVYVVAPGGQAASQQPVRIGGTQSPTVLSFSPEAGAPQSSVTVSGKNFAGAEVVSFNGAPSGSFTLLSDTQIIAYVPNFPQLTTGPLTVTNNQGTSAPAGDFTVTPGPSDLSFTPAAGGLGQAVTITGSDLGGATSVTFGDNRVAADFEVLSDSEIAAIVPAGAVNGPVAVTTPSGTARSGEAFTVLSAAPPADLSFTPAAGGPGASVTITGVNFTGTTLVTFNGALATPYAVQSDTEIVAFVPADATTGPVEVTNSTNPLAPAKSAQNFQFYPAPQITGFNHSNGAAGSPLSISGQNFGGATAVTFGINLIPAASFSVSSDGKMISTTVPPGAVNGPVTVTTPGGTAVSEAVFKVVSSAAPAGITFSPSGGRVGASVTIEGKNFTGTTAVTFFDGAKATSARVESDTAITVRVPKGAATGRVTVTNTVNSASSAADFTVESGSDNASD